MVASKTVSSAHIKQASSTAPVSGAAISRGAFGERSSMLSPGRRRLRGGSTATADNATAALTAPAVSASAPSTSPLAAAPRVEELAATPAAVPAHKTVKVRPRVYKVPTLGHICIEMLAEHADSIVDLRGVGEDAARQLLKEIMRRQKLTYPLAKVFMDCGDEELSRRADTPPPHISTLNLCFTHVSLWVHCNPQTVPGRARVPHRHRKNKPSSHCGSCLIPDGACTKTRWQLDAVSLHMNCCSGSFFPRFAPPQPASGQTGCCLGCRLFLEFARKRVPINLYSANYVRNHLMRDNHKRMFYTEKSLNNTTTCSSFVCPDPWVIHSQLQTISNCVKTGDEKRRKPIIFGFSFVGAEPLPDPKKRDRSPLLWVLERTTQEAALE